MGILRPHPRGRMHLCVCRAIGVARGPHHHAGRLRHRVCVAHHLRCPRDDDRGDFRRAGASLRRFAAAAKIRAGADRPRHDFRCNTGCRLRAPDDRRRARIFHVAVRVASYHHGPGRVLRRKTACGGSGVTAGDQTKNARVVAQRDASRCFDLFRRRSGRRRGRRAHRPPHVAGAACRRGAIVFCAAHVRRLCEPSRRRAQTQ